MTASQTIELCGPVGGETFNVRRVQDLAHGPVHVLVNSGGGCSVSAFAIYRELIEHAGMVTVEILKAGSAASLVSMAGAVRLIRASGWIFLHRTWAVTVGTANTLRAAMVRQEEWDAALAEIYSERTGLPLARVLELMNNETTLSPAEALALGFVHQVIEKKTAARPATKNVPERTALACLQVEASSGTATAQTLRNAAVPAAARIPAVAALLDRPPKIPPIPKGGEALALNAFIEAEQRETQIKRGLAARLRRVVNVGGAMSWPVRCEWKCSVCGATNFHPPAKNRLATLCRDCGDTTREEQS